MLRAYLLTLFLLPALHFSNSDGSESIGEFSRHSRTRPTLYHGRTRREIVTTRKITNSKEHVEEIILSLKLDSKDHLVTLRLNRELITKNHTLKHQVNGSHVYVKPNVSELEMCQYQGEIPGLAGSWAAISTCDDGVSGVVFDGDDLHYIEKANDTDDHLVYNHNHLMTNYTCGYLGTVEHMTTHPLTSRWRRSAELIRGPYNANRRSRYVELVLVIDHMMFKSMNSNLDAVHTRCKDIANIINALYTPLDIFIALVGVVVWTEVDEISLSTKGDNTLTNFLHYRRERLVKDIPNDNAQLLTKIQFDGGVVGKALKGPICTFEFSGGVSMDHSSHVGLVATTVAHEMGHNFGMEHDSQDCHCPDDRCIMAPSSSSTSPTHWSSCSLDYLALAFEHGMDYCLRNKPERLFDSPVCGNGFVEVGEQCDCGLKDRCNNPCCNASTCMLHSNASCATGECCDLTTCHPKLPGSKCRIADHECDLPEFCTGESEYCPSDVFKMDGETCNKGKAFCYQGTCRTHTDQCKLLWGPSGKSSDSQCYKMNTKGSRHGNCGYNRLNQSYIKCYDENIYCGMLHCQHMNERLEFGMESVAILSHSFINSGGAIIPCRTAIVDLGLNEVDPGLSPDGSKCADGKMCVGQRCLPVGSLVRSTDCAHNCNSNGVCNSMGHCHCDTGFAPPDCRDPGTGGSLDSGPASHPNARREVITAFYIVFLGIVPTIALVSLFIYYLKRNPVFKKKPRTIIQEKRPGATGAAREPMGPVESSTSLLPKGGVSPVQDLVGQFKGFSIVPLKQPVAVSTPIRPAPSVPVRPAPGPPRPIISSPVLDDTTANRVKEMIGSAPVRAAPSPPAVVPTVVTTPTLQASTPESRPTIDRITSFIKGKEKPPPKKKIDRERLRTLEISNPIPQQEIELPSAVPAGEGDKSVVMRAQSMREKGIRRAGIPSFGSMRESKRPSSVGSVRPTAPPPRPPTQSYEACLNLLTENSAPLAHIDEESPSSPRENIYAVIDENPLPTGRESPEYKVPRPLDSILPSGLLGEIASEIEARNNDSIYSASTLKKKKELSPQSEYSTCDSMYANTSWKEEGSDSSGYLSPAAKEPESYRPYVSSMQRNGPLAATYRTGSPQRSTLTATPDIVSSCTDSSSKSPDVLSKPEIKSKPEVKFIRPGRPSAVAALQQKFEAASQANQNKKPMTVKR